MSRIRVNLEAPGGLAFFEWAVTGYAPPQIERAVSKCLRRPGIGSGLSGDWPFGQWAENDWEMLIESLRRGGLHVNNPNTRDAIREAVGEWLVYRAKRGLIPDGFEALEDYYWDYIR